MVYKNCHFLTNYSSVLINEKGEPKIAGLIQVNNSFNSEDFGVAASLGSTESQSNMSLIGTPLWYSFQNLI